MMISKVTEKIYKIMNFQKFVNEEDPDYLYIFNLLKKVEDEGGDLIDFYTFLHSSKGDNSRFFTNTGILIRGSLDIAVNDFLNERKRNRIKDMGVEEKAKKLFLKMLTIYTVLKENKKNESFFVEKVGDSSFLRNIKKINEDKSSEKLFTEDDIKTISKMDLSNVWTALGEYNEKELINNILSILIKESGNKNVVKHQIVENIKIDI